MNINSLRYCLRQTSRSFSRNKWLALVSASMIAISLGILGGSLLAAVNTNQIMINIQSNLEMAVFLVEDADRRLLKLSWTACRELPTTGLYPGMTACGNLPAA